MKQKRNCLSLIYCTRPLAPVYNIDSNIVWDLEILNFGITVCCISVHILAPKFYSKYDSQVLEDPSIFEELKRLQETGPKEKYAEPVTENQR